MAAIHQNVTIRGVLCLIATIMTTADIPGRVPVMIRMMTLVMAGVGTPRVDGLATRRAILKRHVAAGKIANQAGADGMTIMMTVRTEAKEEEAAPARIITMMTVPIMRRTARAMMKADSPRVGVVIMADMTVMTMTVPTAAVAVGDRDMADGLATRKVIPKPRAVAGKIAVKCLRQRIQGGDNCSLYSAL